MDRKQNYYCNVMEMVEEMTKALGSLLVFVLMDRKLWML